MDYYITEETVRNKENNEKIKIHALYQHGYKVGYVRCIDYHNNGNHGYGIYGANKERLEQFHKDAKIQFPNSENPYIRFLDLLFPTKNDKSQEY